MNLIEEPYSPTGTPKTASAVALGYARGKGMCCGSEEDRSGLAPFRRPGHAKIYCTRHMFIIHYDDMVPSFFRELVEFLLALRNMLRKAKMVKVFADFEAPDEVLAAGYLDAGKPDDAPLVAADPAGDGAK